MRALVGAMLLLLVLLLLRQLGLRSSGLWALTLSQGVSAHSRSPCGYSESFVLDY
jgi:hypothetical protein